MPRLREDDGGPLRQRHLQRRDVPRRPGEPPHHRVAAHGEAVLVVWRLGDGAALGVVRGEAAVGVVAGGHGRDLEWRNVVVYVLWRKFMRALVCLSRI